MTVENPFPIEILQKHWMRVLSASCNVVRNLLNSFSNALTIFPFCTRFPTPTELQNPDSPHLVARGLNPPGLYSELGSVMSTLWKATDFLLGRNWRFYEQKKEA